MVEEIQERPGPSDRARFWIHMEMAFVLGPLSVGWLAAALLGNVGGYQWIALGVAPTAGTWVAGSVCLLTMPPLWAAWQLLRCLAAGIRIRSHRDRIVLSTFLAWGLLLCIAVLAGALIEETFSWGLVLPLLAGVTALRLLHHLWRGDLRWPREPDG